MPVMRIPGRNTLRRRGLSTPHRGLQRALVCVLSGSIPLLAAAESGAPGDPSAQTASPAPSASDTQQRLQRLEQSQQALQRQLEENAAEIEALKKQANVQPAQPPTSPARNVPPGAAGPAAPGGTFLAGVAGG